MLFESTKTLLRSIVQSLEDGDAAGWDDRIESGAQCLYEIHQMSRSSNRTYQSDKLKSKSQAFVIPISERASHAIPHVKLMVSALRRQDKATAVQSGKAAIVEMDGLRSAVAAAAAGGAAIAAGNGIKAAPAVLTPAVAAQPKLVIAKPVTKVALKTDRPKASVSKVAEASPRAKNASKKAASPVAGTRRPQAVKPKRRAVTSKTRPARASAARAR